jgi:RHS repeat-associated protein
MTAPWGTFRYTYDALDRVITISNPFGQIVNFTYDAIGRRTSLIYPNGTRTSYAYDAAGQVKQIVHQKVSDQTAIAFNNYSYDADGRRINIVDKVGSHNFTYDKLSRLTSASHPNSSTLPIQSETFAYDATGNRTSDAVRNGYMYDAANRIVSDSSFTYTSDANGNVTARRSRASGETTTYIYDSGNHLVQVNGPSGTVATYKYDAAGNRVEKNVDGTIIHYLYDGKNVLAILDANNNILESFTDGPGIDSPLIMREGSQDYFFHADATANVDALTDVNGNVVESYQYQAFGNAVVTDSQGNTHGKSTVGNPFLYASRELDSESGLYYMRARYYGSEAGRFMKEDAIASINQYAYASNNPIAFNDPLGLCPGPLLDVPDTKMGEYDLRQDPLLSLGWDIAKQMLEWEAKHGGYDITATGLIPGLPFGGIAEVTIDAKGVMFTGGLGPAGGYGLAAGPKLSHEGGDVSGPVVFASAAGGTGAIGGSLTYTANPFTGAHSAQAVGGVGEFAGASAGVGYAKQVYEWPKQ